MIEKIIKKVVAKKSEERPKETSSKVIAAEEPTVVLTAIEKESTTEGAKSINIPQVPQVYQPEAVASGGKTAEDAAVLMNQYNRNQLLWKK